MFEVNNKIVLVSGDFESPFYDGVVDINADNESEAVPFKEAFLNELQRQNYSFRECNEFVEALLGEKYVKIYHRTDYISFNGSKIRSFPTRDASRKDYGYSREQQYGDGGSQETERTVSSDSRLAPPSFAPVRKEYVDITGNKRYVIEHNKGEYFVWGTYSPRPHDSHPSIESAIEAENKSLLNAYARDTGQSVGDVKKLLETNPNLLKAWERKRLQAKFLGGKVRRSRSVTETVTLSKGQIAALRTNYKGDKVFAKGTLTTEAEVQIAKNIKADMELLSEHLKKASPQTRERILQSPDLALNYDAEGIIRPEIAAQLETDIKNAGDTSGGIDRRYYSATARGREAQIIEGLAAQGTKVFEGELTKEEGAAYQKAKEIHRKLKSAGFVDTDLVLSETMPDANAYLDGRTVVIGKDTLADGSYVKHLVHETTHFTEGTQEWLDVMDHVFGKDGKAVSHLIERVKTSGYGVTDADVTAVLDAVREGKLKDTALTERQQTLVTEVVAMQMEETFGNEDAINRLVGEKPNLAKRILSRIKAFLQTFGKSTDKDPEAVKQLRRTEELFRKALEKAGVGYAAEELTRMNEKNAQVSEENGGESVDEKRKVQYNYKELYTSTPEYAKEVAHEDREDFNRWLANKTSDMTDGEIRNVLIYCGKKVYFFEADGYMHGQMLRAVSGKRTNIIKQIREAWRNESNQNADTVGALADAFAFERERTDFDSDTFGDGSGENGNDGISFEQSRGDTRRDHGSSGANHQIDLEEVNHIIRELREMLARLDAEPSSKVQKSRKQTGEVQYANKRHFAKQDISTITRASYIHHAWATNELTGCLTPSEISEFNRVIGQMQAGTYAPVPLNDGKYLIEVGEYKNGDRVTYILTDGVWQGQSIEWVGKIVTNNALSTKDIKEYVNELSEALGCEAVALAFDAYATNGVDEGFQEFTLESAVSYEEFARQRTESQGNTGNRKIQHSRKRDVSEIGSNGVTPYRQISPAEEHEYRDFTDAFNVTENHEAAGHLPQGSKIHEYKPSRSRAVTGETVTISKGEMAKLHANYEGDKVFAKGTVTEALKASMP